MIIRTTKVKVMSRKIAFSFTVTPNRHMFLMSILIVACNAMRRFRMISARARVRIAR